MSSKVYSFGKIKMDLPYEPNPRPNRVCILLSMYIGDPSLDREKIYLKTVSRWLRETSFYIYTIDSSGRSLPIEDPRLKQTSFEQPESFVGLSPSLQEKRSLLMAYEAYKADFQNFDLVVKVTGKYFANTLENILKFVPEDADLLVQNLMISHGQNSELVGIRVSKFVEVVNAIGMTCSHFEQTLAMITNFSRYKVYRLPPIYLDKEDWTPRGDGSVLMSL